MNTRAAGIGVLLMSGLAIAVAARAGVGHGDMRAGDRSLVAISNEWYRLAFDPARGGRAVSFLLRETGREWVYDGRTAGLFQDHFAHQGWPGELLEAAYRHEVSYDGDRAVRIRLWTVATGGADGRDALTRGLQVEKTVTLHAGRRDVRVVNAFVNPTTEGKNVGLWVQQCFGYGGDRLFDLYYRPSTHGIHLTGRDDTGANPYLPVTDVYSADFVGSGKYTDAGGREPVAGWTAGRDRRSNEGAVFLLDYHYLDVLYNSAGSYTTEWFLDPVPLPPGKTWSTEYTVIPVNGFTGFTHASARLIAHTEATPGENRVEIEHQFAGATAAAGTITVHTRLYGVRSKTEAELPPLVLSDVGLTPQGASQTWDRPQTEPLVLRVAVSGPDWEETYEHLFEGAFAGTGIQGAGQVAEYTIPRPAKQKVFLKPDSWERPRNERLRVLVLYGLFSHHYRIEEAARALDPKAEIVISRNWDTFPPTYDELLRFDLIVLSNVPAGPDYANVMISDVVSHAGVGLLALGGLGTFGGGQWRGTELANVLPGEILTSFDLAWEPAGVFPETDPAHPASAGVVFPPDARFYWIHELQPRAGAVAAVKAGDRPLLLVSRIGAGRVAAATATCHGEPGEGRTGAWDTEDWIQLLKQSMAWLTGGK